MKLLLDSHAFLWLTDEPERLPKRVVDFIHDLEVEIFLSAVSVWELQIKQACKNLTFRRPLAECVALEQEANGLQVLPLHAAHVWELGRLPALHKDPFDRMLIAQARAERMKLVTADKAIKRYEVDTLW